MCIVRFLCCLQLHTRLVLQWLLVQLPLTLLLVLQLLQDCSPLYQVIDAIMHDQFSYYKSFVWRIIDLEYIQTSVFSHFQQLKVYNMFWYKVYFSDPHYCHKTDNINFSMKKNSTSIAIFKEKFCGKLQGVQICTPHSFKKCELQT